MRRLVRLPLTRRQAVVTRKPPPEDLVPDRAAVLVPLGITLWVLNAVIGTMDQSWRCCRWHGSPKICSGCAFRAWAPS
jgi:hypothetical protein